jgi:hypothetical protein
MIAIRNLLSISSQQVMRNLGYEIDSEPPPRVASIVDEYIDHANELIDPLYSYVIREVEWTRGNISFVQGQVIFKSRVIARLLEQSRQVAILVLTIGNRLEDMVRHLVEEGLVFQATVLDAVGSAAVEELADSIQDRIADLAGLQGMCISRRFSPGYCDWHIGQQRMVFQAMGDDHAGVRLTGKCLMLPQKSVSGIIGMGPCGTVDSYNPCPTCDQHDCTGRR